MSEYPYNVEFVAPEQDWHSFIHTPIPAFAPIVLEFLGELSTLLRAHSEPDLNALGFWLRARSLAEQQTRVSQRSPLGLVFHLVPSNVPTVAFYSWLMALLMGNASIIRLSSRQDPLQQQLLMLCNQLFAQVRFAEIALRTRFIRYGHAQEITATFSYHCQLRIIWGGDETVSQIRAVPLAPQAQELVFANRRSMALIDTNWLIQAGEQEWKNTIAAFSQDLTRFNQQACASPTTLIWLGKPSAALRQRFLDELFAPFALNPALAMERLINTQRSAAKTAWFHIEKASNYTALQTEKLENLTSLEVGGGVIAEMQIKNLPELKNAFDAVVLRGDSIGFQTCVCIGFAKRELGELLQQNPSVRLDRLVSPGQALAFDWYWDGIDMLKSCSRKAVY